MTSIEMTMSSRKIHGPHTVGVVGVVEVEAVMMIPAKRRVTEVLEHLSVKKFRFKL